MQPSKAVEAQCASGPAPSLPTCLVVTRQHPSPVAVPGPAVLCLFWYPRCLPCLPCCNPASQLASALGRPLLLLPDSLKASKCKKQTHLFLIPHLLSLSFKKNAERKLIHAQSDKRKKNRGFHLISICNFNSQNCLQYALNYPDYLHKMRHLEEGLNLKYIPFQQQKRSLGVFFNPVGIVLPEK